MNIITKKQNINLENDIFSIVFNNDDELNLFIQKLINIPVLTSGLRILTLKPNNMELSSLQIEILDIIKGLDGCLSKDEEKHNEIINNNVDKINKIIDKN